MYYASGLEMIAEHATGLTKGEHTVAEFADFYALLSGPLQCQRRMPRVEDKK